MIHPGSLLFALTLVLLSPTFSIASGSFHPRCKAAAEGGASVGKLLREYEIFLTEGGSLQPTDYPELLRLMRRTGSTHEAEITRWLQLRGFQLEPFVDAIVADVHRIHPRRDPEDFRLLRAVMASNTFSQRPLLKALATLAQIVPEEELVATEEGSSAAVLPVETIANLANGIPIEWVVEDLISAARLAPQRAALSGQFDQIFVTVLDRRREARLAAGEPESQDLLSDADVDLILTSLWNNATTAPKKLAEAVELLESGEERILADFADPAIRGFDPEAIVRLATAGYTEDSVVQRLTAAVGLMIERNDSAEVVAKRIEKLRHHVELTDIVRGVERRVRLQPDFVERLLDHLEFDSDRAIEWVGAAQAAEAMDFVNAVLTYGFSSYELSFTLMPELMMANDGVVALARDMLVSAAEPVRENIIAAIWRTRAPAFDDLLLTLATDPATITPELINWMSFNSTPEEKEALALLQGFRASDAIDLSDPELRDAISILERYDPDVIANEREIAAERLGRGVTPREAEALWLAFQESERILARARRDPRAYPGSAQAVTEARREILKGCETFTAQEIEMLARP